MTRRNSSVSEAILMASGLLLALAAAPVCIAAEPSAAAAAAFNAYAGEVESRLAEQHRSPNAFLTGAALTPQNEMRLHQGEPIIEQLSPSRGADLPGALLHHWRGTAFVRGATAADFERLMRDFNSYPRDFSPQVLQARILSQDGDHLQATMRIVQHHMITVVLDTTSDITYGRLDSQHGYSLSRSTRISEIGPSGRALDPSEEHGFLWRLNTYWSYEERDGGLYMQIETVSLTRSIPAGLGWVVRPYVERIPRESLEFTLRSVCNALRPPEKK